MRCALIMMSAVALAACQPTRPAGPPIPSTSYAKVMPPSAKPSRGQCLSADEATTIRSRIVQQELAFAARACGMGADYERFVGKYAADLSANGSGLTLLLRRRGVNINAFVTDIANKVSTRASSYGAFCGDAREAYRWALRPATTQLAEVPPLYDNTADHGIKPCNAPAAR
ncbi:MAG: hypothetical protein AB7G10_16520 [Reyranellaceae bacterium]